MISAGPKIFAILALLLLNEIAGVPAFAASVTLDANQVSNSSLIESTIRLLNPGDTVTLNYPDHQETFTLGKVLGVEEGPEGTATKGTMSRVFLLPGDYNPPRIIKFQKGGERARDFMKGEVEAMESLKADGIPHPEMRGHDNTFYVIKDFIPGSDLASVESSWSTIPAERRAKLLGNLSALFSKILNSGHTYTDLNSYNIMLDESSDQFKVIDPGFLIPYSSTIQLDRVKEKIYTRARRMNDELAIAEVPQEKLTAMLEVLDAQQNPEKRNAAIDRLFSLEPTAEEINQFKSTSSVELGKTVTSEFLARSDATFEKFIQQGPTLDEIKTKLETITDFETKLRLAKKVMEQSSSGSDQMAVLSELHKTAKDRKDLYSLELLTEQMTNHFLESRPDTASIRQFKDICENSALKITLTKKLLEQTNSPAEFLDALTYKSVKPDREYSIGLAKLASQNTDRFLKLEPSENEKNALRRIARSTLPELGPASVQTQVQCALDQVKFFLGVNY
jgi:hypothetical protein